MVILFNIACGNLLYVLKLMSLSVAISGTYFFFKGFEKRPADSGMLLAFAVFASSYHSLGIGRLHRITRIVASAKVVILPLLWHRTRGSKMQSGPAMYLRKMILCTPEVAIVEGGFQRIPRPSVPIFVDFFLQRVISLLVANK